MSKCKEMFGKAVKLMVDLATMQVENYIYDTTTLCPMSIYMTLYIILLFMLHTFWLNDLNL